MDSPKSSPISEEPSSTHLSEKLSPEVSPSLSQSISDLTKQLLNWPQFGIALNFAEKVNSIQKEDNLSKNGTEAEHETEEIPEFSLAKAHWTPKWPENFTDVSESPYIEEDQEDAHQNDQNDKYPTDEKDTNQNGQNDKDPNDQKDTKQKDPNDNDPKDQRETNQNHSNDKDSNDPRDTNQNYLKKSSKVSFAMTDTSDTTEDMDKEIENESSEIEQPELTSHNDDVPTLILRIPSWSEDDPHSEDFDSILSEIPSYIDSNTDDNIIDENKWSVEFGNNRNYIKALINYDVNNIWPKSIKSKRDFEKVEKIQKFKWIINYDNLNYIRSLLNPEVFERVLKGEIFNRKESYSLNRHRERLANLGRVN